MFRKCWNCNAVLKTNGWKRCPNCGKLPTDKPKDTFETLPFTDDELDCIYKAITATQIRGGVEVRRREKRPGLGGKGKFQVIAPALRGRHEYVIADVGKALDADVIAHSFNNLAFLIESLRSERKAFDARPLREISR
jgi:hypothetical protein